MNLRREPRNSEEPSNDRQLQNNIMVDGLIYDAVWLWVTDQPAAMKAYGDIRFWDTSRVTSMYSLFGAWNPRAVIPGTFGGWYYERWASSFNSDLSRWDTSNVTDMSRIFYAAYSFNQALCWDTSKVVNWYQWSNGSPVRFTAIPDPVCTSLLLERCKDDPISFPVMIDCEWVSNNAEIACNLSTVKDICPRSCVKSCSSLPWSDSPSITPTTESSLTSTHAPSKSPSLSRTSLPTTALPYGPSSRVPTSVHPSTIRSGRPQTTTASPTEFSMRVSSESPVTMRPSTAPSKTSNPSRGPSSTASPSLLLECYDSNLPFEWLNGLPIDCDWVAKNVEIACSHRTAYSNCPQSCGLCSTRSPSTQPSAKPSPMPHPMSMSMSQSP
jgi:surface protein